MCALHLLWIITLAAVSSSSAAPHLRRSLLFHSEHQQDDNNNNNTVDCLYVKGHLRLEDGRTKDLHGCETNRTIYKLPPGLIQDYASLHSGSTRIQIIGAKTTTTTTQSSNGNAIVLLTGPPPVVSISQSATRSDYDSSNGILKKATGVTTVLAVRVTSRDSIVSMTAAELSEGLFTAPVSFASQFRRCSAGALQFVPALGDNIQQGVGELYIDQNTIGVYSTNLHGIMLQAFHAKFGNESNYGHILFCLPRGTVEEYAADWIAYAFLDSQFSYYNNEWCGSLTTKMHEVGHNLGVGHSGQGVEGAYGDGTCLMGVSFPNRNGPQECFNGWRNWSLGWFAPHQITVQLLPWNGKLASFVDYKDIAKGDYAIVNVGDLYLQYNRAKKYNWEVGEKRNQVTIVKSGVAVSESSDLLGGLDMTLTTFTYQANGMNIVIEVCEPGSYGSVDYFQIGIYQAGQASSCIVAPIDTLPSAAPTMPPTTTAPTTSSAPSDFPTASPHPSAMPSLSPRPTQAPTLSPSQAPTPQPTLTWQQFPRPTRTRAPTRNPTPPRMEEVVPEKNDPECDSMFTHSHSHGC